MTEAEWLDSRDLDAMLVFLQDKVSKRKLRLWVCACCRLLWWQELREPSSRNAVEVGEMYADGQAGSELLAAARSGAQGALAAAQAEWTRLANPQQVPAHYRGKNRLLYNLASWLLGSWDKPEVKAAASAARRSFQAAEAALACVQVPPRLPADPMYVPLLREIIGNPFSPPQLPPSWPEDLVALAQALYNGRDRRLELQAALQNQGLSTLAEHFQSPRHPKGCWAVDLILGQE